uniref:Protein zer-1 homolog-like C-terminal domain-containing protein n=1 Tax=Glossina palpalis gambiensis TaxID=67801 RepID=A0A1B0AVN1_9MUSC
MLLNTLDPIQNKYNFFTGRFCKYAVNTHSRNASNITYIAGDANEQQILTAARYYYDRPVLLTRVLNDLYHLFRFENCKDIHTALDVVLTAMDRHLKFKHMQISGSATLFYIVKGRDRAKFGTPLRNHIIRTLLNGMEVHITDDTMLRNGYLTLTQFQMPTDVVSNHKCILIYIYYSLLTHDGK